MPGIASAGRTTTVVDEGTQQCMAIEERPDTPPEVRKFRKSMFAEAGQKVIHPGLVSKISDLPARRKGGTWYVSIPSIQIDDSRKLKA
jgi:hypothetical protein